MAHSCRWRFPARPGTGRRLGARHRMAAVLQPREEEEEGESGVSPGAGGSAVPPGVGGGGSGFPPGVGGGGVPPGGSAWSWGVGPGYDAALQVSAAIGSNLRRFRDVSGGSSGEEELFLGFGSDEEVKTRSPTKSPTDQTATRRKPRGRPRNSTSRSSDTSSHPTEIASPPSKHEPRPPERAKKQEVKPEEKRRGRPPANGSVKFKLAQEKRGIPEPTKVPREEKTKKRKPSATFQQAAKIKKLRAVKLSPLKSKFKSGKLQLGRNGGVPIVRRRGRPPSSERFKATPPGDLLKQAQAEKPQKGRKEESPQPSKEESKVSVRQSPRRVKPVRIIPSSKRTDTTIAKQLLQKAKKGAQKKIELEAAKLQGRKGGTQLKNIRQFIMPVVSTVSSRIIKTPRRFIEDEDYEPPIKIARVESAPNSGRFGAASCGSSEKSSAASQHSSQATSDDSRSSSPSVDTSTESQASEELPALPEEEGRTPETLAPAPTPQPPAESNGGARSRRFPVCGRTFSARPAKKATSQPILQQPSASPPPPLLSPPTPLQPPTSLSDHTPWLMPSSIPMTTSFLSASRMHEKRRSILREPTFRWTSLKHSRLESQYFSSAKYAKEGLIRKPIFDNFRPPPLTPEDVGLASASGFPSPSVVGPGRLFSPLHASGARFDVHKRSPILRAPRFTPSEAHSRIFESVTLPSSAGRSGGASSMMGMSSRRRKRRVFSPMLGTEPRSPSHSMRTRSRRVSSGGLSSLAPPSSASLPGVSVGPIAASALNPGFSFSSASLTPTPGDSAEKSQKPRKQTSSPGEPFSSSNGSPGLYPWFSSSPQAEKGRCKNRAPEEALKERDTERSREKENSRDSRKERRKNTCKLVKEKGEGDAVSVATIPVKTPGRKKPGPAEPSPDVAPAVAPSDVTPAKNKAPKKARGGLEKPDLETSAKPLPAEAPAHLPSQPASGAKPSTISSMLAQADKVPVTDKRVASLLKKAKAQLYKIEKSKFLKQSDPPKVQGQESDSSETSVRGPRIKHVCRRAAVALGRKRAVFPDDMPTLSALPWEEREKVLSSMGNDDKSSIAGSEDADPPAPPLKPIKQVTRNKAPQEPAVKKGRRSRRCGQCPGCQVPEDCGVCTNCLDKPKFGGRNIKKQCCKMRKCQNLQWMPSKAYLQKQAKAAKKKDKKAKGSEKEIPAVKSPPEPTPKAATPPSAPPPAREEPPVPPPKKSEPPRKASEEEGQPVPTCEAKPPSVPRKAPLPPQTSPPPPARKEAPKTGPSESRKKQPPALTDTGAEQNKHKKLTARLGALMKSKPKEKEKTLPVSKPETFNLLTPLSNGGSSRQKPPADGVHRVRVDLKEDCEVGNVWEIGGLSILTSVPITPRVVCFLCASSGHVEFVYCQVCCEPFHKFCLEERERPSEEQLENWCCRHCKFCHVCGRQNQAAKQLLECNKCRNSYHPECLGPNYPTKPTKKKRVWICTKCVRCKSCGSTTPGKGWDAQWSHDFSLCHDCAKLFAKGNFCPLCDKCYDDDDYESKMMQCGKCDRWVHSKCESLTDEMYEILSNLPESVAYTCINCTDHHPAEWRLALTGEVQGSLKHVLTALLNSRTSSHLLRYTQAAKPPDLNPEPEENLPSRSSPEGPDPPVLTQVNKLDVQPPLDLEGVRKKMDHSGYTSVLEFSDDIVRIIQAAMNADGGQPEVKKANSMMKSFFTRQMERVFPWFSVKKSRFWEPNKVTSNSGMLPNAVLPPSLDHNYAQWQEREENRLAVQPPLMKKIIPAPKAKAPGDPESPRPVHPPTPPALAPDHFREQSPELRPPPGVGDNRQCSLCLKYGDDNANDAGRLLYVGQDEWTHVNCALWSAEVFEDDDGSLKNVHMAVIRGKQLRCELCLKLGATVGCCLTTCTSNYHFMCSRSKSCVFLEDKKVYCQKHRDLIKGEVVPDNGFEVLRRVFVDFEGISLRRKFLNGLEPERIHVMIGSMTIDCLGILNDLSDCEEKLFPMGYQCSRVYWSTTDARKRCVYTCKIMECRPPPADPDINSTVQHEENHTIAHSPTPLTESQSTEGVKGVKTPSLPSPKPLSASPASSPWVLSRHSGSSRLRTPKYSPTLRSPGSRPLPSAGSLSPVTHEIVTVGDPLLSSGLRSIGSRRHSASSLSPQQKPCLTSPQQTLTSGRSLSPPVVTITSRRSLSPPIVPITSRRSLSPPVIPFNSRRSLSPPVIPFNSRHSLSPPVVPFNSRHSLSPPVIPFNSRHSLSPPVVPITSRRSLSPPVTITPRRSLSPPIVPITSRRSLSPPVIPITSRRSLSPPVIPITSRRSLSPPVIPITSRRSLSPPVIPITSRSSLSPPVVPVTSRPSLSPPIVPLTSRRSLSPPVVTIVSRRSLSPPVVTITPRRSLSPPVTITSRRSLSPPVTTTSRHSLSPPIIPINSADHMASSSENIQPALPSGTSSIVRKSSFVHSDGHSPTVVKAEKLSETRRPSPFENLPKTTALKTDKAKSSAPGISDSSTHPLNPKISSQPQGMSTPDSSTGRAGLLKDTPPTPLNFKAASPPQQRRATRRENDKRAELSLAEKSAAMAEGNDSQLPVRVVPVSASDHGISVTKDRRPKSKKLPLENSKEKHSSKAVTDPERMLADSQRQPDTNGNHTAPDTSGIRPHAHSKYADKSVSTLGSSQLEASSVSATKIGIDETHDGEAEKQSAAPPYLSAEATATSPEVSDGAGVSAANHTSPNTDSESQTSIAFPSQGTNLLLQDGSKTQEDGSFKRRYPRRSARARSNMFFGLTPLYGVRSYGEEDLPFCSSTPGKKRGKRSAEGQVDGADDLSSSDEDDLYYYNFTRTVVSSAVDERLGARVLFREEDQRDLHKIPQLDGVDDGTESDTKVPATTGKAVQAGKMSGKENGAEKLEASEEQAEKEHAGKGHKAADSKMENCHPVKQDSLESQLSMDTARRGHSGADKNLLDTFNAELLKSDSDNNNSDDCGNILPIDIMDFVLKNTPSMQALGESPESSSSELLTLGDGLGLDSNRGKDMGLFEVFSQQLPTSEPVDGEVPSAMSAEEQFELPMELPSDLSVLTTRSPALPSQNHSRIGVISESPLSSPSERSLLSVPTPDSVEKRVTVTEKPVTSSDGDPALLGQSVDRPPKGHMTPDRFIPGHIDTEHMPSPPCGQVDHTGSQDMARNCGTPTLQVPVSPTVPLQNQKYVHSSTESPGPSQIQDTAIQSTPPHLKSATEKLVVMNQNMQPLYVFQTLPNGVTQKIQLTQSVPGSGRMEGDVSVLGPMGGGLTLATALNPGLTPSPTLFPPANKGLLPITPHLHPFSSGPQTAFLPTITNQPSGLLIGVQPSTELLVSETGQRVELGGASNPPTPGMNKKRQISRLHTRKNKKLAPSVSPASRQAPEVVSNMTLINFAPSQLAGGLTNHPNLIDLGPLGNPTPHRSIPNIIKRSKSGVMYFDRTPLLPQGVGAASSVVSSPSLIGMDAGHLTGQVPGLVTGSPVLNVVSMQASPATPVTGHVTLGQGSVTLTSQGILRSPELGSISNFLIKAGTHGLGIKDNHVTLPPGPGICSHSPTAATMVTTSSICVMPTTQPVGMTLTQQVPDPDCPYPLSHHKSRLLSSKPLIQPDPTSVANPRSPTHRLPPDTQGKAGPQGTQASSTCPGSGLQTRGHVSPLQKTKSKAKRQPPPTDKTSRKKHKASHPTHAPTVAPGAERYDKAAGTHKPKTDVTDLKGAIKDQLAESGPSAGHLPVIPDPQAAGQDPCPTEPKQDGPRPPGEDDAAFSSPLMLWLQQEQSRQSSPRETEPRSGLLFQISSDDGFHISAGSIEEAWKSLTDKVQEARSNARLKQLSFAGVNGLRMLGIIHNAIVFLVEQLYGANRCRNYKFRFHRPPGKEEPPLNPHGAARAEVHLRKSAFDMFNFLASKHRQPPEYRPNDEEEEEVQLKSARRATSMDLPMPMRFRHLKKTSKEAVGVYRSPIHGRGLFCRRNIDVGEMVIEYSGNVIRSPLTDKREKYYAGKGIGCYMFRIDDSEVVDATMHGNAARFINHSCEPNCYSRVIPIDGQKHIVIFAMRRISRGEELTYDYKFPIEDASNKLLCNCSTKKCRKFLN